MKYTVETNDSLSLICERYYYNANLYPLLGKHNGIEDPYPIQAGQILDLPPHFFVEDRREGSEHKGTFHLQIFEYTPSIQVLFEQKPGGADLDSRFLVVDDEHKALLEREIEWFDRFTPHMEGFIAPQGEPGPESAAHCRALFEIMNEFIDAEDDEAAAAIVDDLDRLLAQRKQIHEQEIRSEEVNPQEVETKSKRGHKIKDGSVRHVFWVSGQRRVRIRSTKIKQHWRTHNRAQTLAKIKEGYLAKGGDGKNGGKKSPTSKDVDLIGYKIFKEDGEWSDEVAKFNDECKIDIINNEIANMSADAEFLRWAVEAKAGATYDWTENRKVFVGGKAQGSFTVAQGNGSFDLNLPSEDGFDLIEFLRKHAPQEKGLIHAKTGKLRLRFTLLFTGTAFVGASASVFAGAGLQLATAKNPGSEGGFEAGLDAFAGAKVQASVALECSAKISTSSDGALEAGDWKALAKVEYGGYAAAGLGLTGSFKFGYYDGRLRLVAKIGLVVKLGAGTFLKVAVDVQQIYKVCLAIAEALDWENISDYVGEQVRDVFQSIIANMILTGRKAKEIIGEIGDSLDDLLRDATDATRRGMGVLKQVDDVMDEYLPGYTGFKRHNRPFLLLRSTHDALETAHRGQSKQEAVIRVIQSIDANNQWSCMTWQLKCNLLEDIAAGGRSTLGRGHAISLITGSIRHEYERTKIRVGLAKRGFDLGELASPATAQ